MITPNLTRVKICGITKPSDAEFVASCGVDAIGLVFYPKSPRYVSDFGLAREIIAACGPFVTAVALMVNSDEGEINRLLREVPVSLLQFHGDEGNEFCTRFERPFIKAIRVKHDLNVADDIAKFPDARGILLDSYTPGIPGGTGESFNWEKVPVNPRNHIILAGGLSPDNVQAAIRATEPYGVDVSSGVEVSPGIKDKQKVKAFVSKAKSE